MTPMPAAPTLPPSTPPATPPTAPLNVGLIGFGYAGATLHAPLLATTPGLALAAVASSRPHEVHAALGPAVVVVPDAQALIALARSGALQVMVIASPNSTHAPLARAALEAGCHVVVDKPFALNTAEAAPLVALAEARGLVLSVFHNRRWDGDFLTAQALLAAGTLGQVTEARMHFDRFRPVVRDRWREGSGPGAGLYLDLAPHLLDQALQLFGEPTALSADIGRQRPAGQSDDHFCLRLRYASGLRVTLSASMLSALPGPRFVLHGTRGSWLSQTLDNQEEALKAGQRPDPQRPDAWGAQADGVLCATIDPTQPPQPRPWPTQPGRWPAYYAALRDAVRGSGANPVPARQALQVQAWVDLGHDSNGRRCERTLAPTGP